MKGSLQILDRTGHSTVAWDTSVEDTVSAAKTAFDEAVKDGALAYKIEGNGKKGEQIKEFDPLAETIIVTPALVGGAR